MAFFRNDAGAWVEISVTDLKALLDEQFPAASNRERYLLYPNELGNLAISTHFVEGPDGPGKYYLGFIDMAKGEVRWANKEGDFPDNTFVRHSGEVLNGPSLEANTSEGEAMIRKVGD